MIIYCYKLIWGKSLKLVNVDCKELRWLCTVLLLFSLHLTKAMIGAFK